MNKTVSPCKMTDKTYLSATDFPWSQELTEEEVNSVINLGYHVFNLTRKHSTLKIDGDTSGDDTESSILSSQINNLQYDIRETKNTINETNALMKKTLFTSCLKGKMGEQTILDVLCEHFPDDAFHLSSGQAHSGDIQMLPVSNKKGKVMIEIKTYKNAVPTSEVDKFKNDLERSKFPLGLFISSTSTIMKKRRIQIERYGRNNAIIVYVPNAINNPTSIVYGILVLQQLYMHEQKSNLRLIHFETVTQNIYRIMERFDLHLQDICAKSYDMKKKLDVIDSNTATLRKMIDESTETAQRILKQISCAVQNEIDLTTLLEEPQQDETTIQTFLKYKSKSKPDIYPLYDSIFTFMRKHNLEFSMKNDTTILFNKLSKPFMKITEGQATLQCSPLLHSGIKFELDKNSSSIALHYTFYRWLQMDEITSTSTSTSTEGTELCLTQE